jgi:uncharacterized protein YlxP (DUF503 family)
LKGKRHVLRSITTRVKNEFNVAVAEVASQDLWQVAEIGVCCVSNESHHANEMISKVIDFIERSSIDAEVLDIETEVIPSL